MVDRKWLKWTFVVIPAFLMNCLYLYNESQTDLIRYGIHPPSMTWVNPAYSFYKHGFSDNFLRQDLLERKGYQICSKYTTEDFLVFPIEETIGYPLLAAALWWVSQIPTLLSLKLLNILLFCLMLFPLYRVCRYLFINDNLAFLMTFFIGTYPPFFWLNVVWYRDVFHYFGFILFLYVVFSFLIEEKPMIFGVIGAILFTALQWIRATLFPSLMIFSLFFLFWSWRGKFSLKKMSIILSLFFTANFVLFWVPFMIFNHFTYGRLFSGPVGEATMASLVGPSFSITPLHQYASAKSSIKKISFDQACLETYYDIKKQHPFEPLKAFIYRIVNIPFSTIQWRPPAMTWSLPEGLTQKLLGALTSKSILVELFLRVYVHLIKLFGLLGILLLLYRKEYFVVTLFLFGIIYNSFYMIFSHIEDRILVVHLWPFVLCACYFVHAIFGSVCLKYKSYVKSFFVHSYIKNT